MRFRIAGIVVLAVGMSGCLMKFGYVEPPDEVDQVTFPKVEEQAKKRAAAYRTRSKNLMLGAVTMDTGLMLGGASALAFVTFDAHQDYAKIAAATMAVIYGVREYFVFNDRRDRKLAGHKAHLCIRDALVGVSATEAEPDPWPIIQTNRNLVLQLGAQAKTDGETERFDRIVRVLKALDARTNGPSWALSAMDRVDLKIAQATPVPDAFSGLGQEIDYRALLGEGALGADAAKEQSNGADEEDSDKGETPKPSREEVALLALIAQLDATTNTQRLSGLDDQLDRCVDQLAQQ